jgi:cytochrome bd-type quinol oxidase subunit 2
VDALFANQISMRWKLLVIASLAAALVACGLWSAFAIGLFGTARDLARHDWLLPASALVPLAIAAYAGVFVYRHTARRRKTQAVFAVILALVLSAGTYCLASQVFPDKLNIPRAYEVHHTR